jgi:hypothetical protein
MAGYMTCPILSCFTEGKGGGKFVSKCLCIAKSKVAQQQ